MNFPYYYYYYYWIHRLIISINDCNVHCRCDRPSSIYLYICWVGGPVQGQPVVLGKHYHGSPG